MEVLERGWAGHFICSYGCRFRRNTLLTHCGISIIISTVGSYYPNTYGKMETIGDNRWYETMAFYGVEDENGYIDADVEKQIEFRSECGIFGDYDSLPNNVDNVANNIHEAVVLEFFEKMMRGQYESL